MMKRIVVFASGSGTNVQNIAGFFATGEQVSIVRIYTNNPEAYVIRRAESLGIPCCVFSREQFSGNDLVLDLLKADKPDLIVLAGFLWLIPSKYIHQFPGKIINIHPALLPKFGGRGMYGRHVHEAVISQKELQSGITIHHVNESYDEGAVIFQATCGIEPGETTDSLAEKIHRLEYEHYPKVIKKLLLGNH